MDWLKIQSCTPDKPEVIAIATALGIDRDAAFGKCFRVWKWFDEHTENGYARGVTVSFIDAHVGVTGFAQAMMGVHWLVQKKDGLMVPNFDRHNGKTAKNRALSAERMQRLRCASSVTKASPEKRREEKNSSSSTPAAAEPSAGEGKAGDPVFDALTIAGIGEPKRSSLMAAFEAWAPDAAERLIRAKADANREAGKRIGALVRTLEAAIEAEAAKGRRRARAPAAAPPTAEPPAVMPFSEAKARGLIGPPKGAA